MRKDGAFIIYMIQHCPGPEADWKFSSLDYFGHPPGFNASGECWQDTGIHGVYSEKEAVEGLAWIAKRNPGVTFRLVRRITFQFTEPVHA